MTISEKNAISRFGTFLAIAKGDAERAVELFRKQCPRDIEHLAALAKILKATK